ncbi:acyl-CoA N-acyltransferase [Chytridium lagenaria]|nr:acyl-CoA N-acyltransferase [Chytridium lagenaria]
MACPNNLSIPVLRRLNSVLFPIPYNDRFYTTVLENWILPSWYAKFCIGAISCRREPLTLQPSDKRVKVYIMTLGVLAPYRRLQIGTLLVESVISRCQADPYIDHFILHVQTTNREAIRFYKARGFRVEERVDGYYNLNKGVDPPDAYLLRRNLVGKKAERVQTPPPSQSEAVPSAVGLPRCSSPTPPNSSPAMGESLVETKNLSSCPKEKSSPNLPQEQLWRTNDIQTTSPSTSSSPARVDVTTFMPLRTPSIPGQSPWMNVSGPLGKAFAKQATRGM